MPKLLRGSSLSSDDKGRAEGAGTAADCTERAGESSLELLLESLWQNSNMDGDAVVKLASTNSAVDSKYVNKYDCYWATM